jgi:hypothetical protein
MDPAARSALAEAAWLEHLESLRRASGGQMLAAMRDERVVDVGGFEDVDGMPVGARLGFRASFRTKNMTGRDLADLQVIGDLDRDPHVYLRGEFVESTFPSIRAGSPR